MEQLLERISVDPGVIDGKPVIRGTRLTVQYIVGLLARGATAAEILNEHKGLTEDDIRACLAFAELALETAAGMPLPIPIAGAEISSRDGFVRFRACPSPEYALARLNQTKEFGQSVATVRLAMVAYKLRPAAVFGALWQLFGPPQDIIDDWKESFAFYFDVIVRPSLRQSGLPESLLLFLRVSDYKGHVQVQLRMPRRGERDEVLEEGDDILPERLRADVIGFFIGYLEGYLETGKLHDFERRFADSAGGGRYGVRDGVPFEEEEPEEEDPDEEEGSAPGE